MNKKLCYPLPEVIAPDIQWKIENADDGKACMSFESATMRVPLRRDKHLSIIRNHEMAHTRFTPRDWNERMKAAGVDLGNATIQAVEDYRVNYLASLAGVNMSAGYGSEFVRPTCQSAIHRGDKKFALLTMIAYGAIKSDLEITNRELSPVTTRTLLDVASYVRIELSKVPTFENTIRLTKRIDAMFPNAPEDNSGDSGDLKENELPWNDCDESEDNTEPSNMPSSMPNDGKYLPPESMGLSASVNECLGYEADEYTIDAEAETLSIVETINRDKVSQCADALSGTMEVLTPDLPLMIPQKGTKQFTSAKEGAVFFRPHMLTVNGKVFRSVSKHAPATYLIDVSGSMSLSVKDVQKLILNAPASIVAIYSGHTMYAGRLVIVARNGRMAKEDTIMRNQYGGNIIDYPALKWLARQRGRKFWICDGRVTGQGDVYNPIIDKACNRVIKQANIQRVVFKR